MPVPEIQFDGFAAPAFDQIVSHLAKYRMRTRGDVDMPVTIRIPSFGGIGAVEHHSESTETYWLHTAGLKVVVPSTPSDAYWLLRYAIAERDPVIFLEPKRRYWAKEVVDTRNPAEPIGRASFAVPARTSPSSPTAPWSPPRSTQPNPVRPVWKSSICGR